MSMTWTMVLAFQLAARTWIYGTQTRRESIQKSCNKGLQDRISFAVTRSQTRMALLNSAHFIQAGTREELFTYMSRYVPLKGRREHLSGPRNSIFQILSMSRSTPNLLTAITARLTSQMKRMGSTQEPRPMV